MSLNTLGGTDDDQVDQERLKSPLLFDARKAITVLSENPTTDKMYVQCRLSDFDKTRFVYKTGEVGSSFIAEQICAALMSEGKWDPSKMKISLYSNPTSPRDSYVVIDFTVSTDDSKVLEDDRFYINSIRRYIDEAFAALPFSTCYKKTS